MGLVSHPNIFPSQNFFWWFISHPTPPSFRKYPGLCCIFSDGRFSSAKPANMMILSWLKKINKSNLSDHPQINYIKSAIFLSTPPTFLMAVSLTHSLFPFKQDVFFPYRCIRNDYISPKPHRLTVCPLDTIAWPALCSSSPIMCD